MSADTEALPTEMTSAFYETYAPEAYAIAARNHHRSSIVDVQDIEQAIWEHVLVNWKHYAKAEERFVSIYMAKAARGFMRQERVEHMYATGAFIYTPKITAAYLDTCAWEPLEDVPDIDARVDLQEAFVLLRASAPKQAEAVFKRYGLGEQLTESEQKNLSRGVESLTHRLNSGLRLQAESIDLVTRES